MSARTVKLPQEAARLIIAAAVAPAQLCHAGHGNDPVPCVAFMLLGLTDARAFAGSCEEVAALVLSDLPVNLRSLRVTYGQRKTPVGDVTAALAMYPHHRQLRALNISGCRCSHDQGVELVAALSGAGALRELDVDGQSSEGGVGLATATAATLRRLALVCPSGDTLDMSALAALRVLQPGFCGGAPQLSVVVFPPRLRRIGLRALWGNRVAVLDMAALRELTHIGNQFGYGMKHLREVLFPPNLVSVGHRCLNHCALAAVDMSQCARPCRVGDNFAAFCPNLKGEAAPPRLTAVGSGLFFNSPGVSKRQWHVAPDFN
jgi:hypothetical protein